MWSSGEGDDGTKVAVGLAYVFFAGGQSTRSFLSSHCDAGKATPGSLSVWIIVYDSLLNKLSSIRRLAVCINHSVYGPVSAVLLQSSYDLERYTR